MGRGGKDAAPVSAPPAAPVPSDYLALLPARFARLLSTHSSPPDPGVMIEAYPREGNVS